MMTARFGCLLLVPLVAAASALAIAACSSSSPGDPAAPIVDDAAAPADDAAAADLDAAADVAADAAADAPVPGTCADTFGSALTAGFGRLDGTVFAVQKPSDTACTLPNSDHVVLQVLMGGAVYRMVVNVQSDRGGPDIRIQIASLAHALPAPAFSEGWHLDAPLDYVTTLGVHAGDAGDAGDAVFTPYTLDDATAQLVSQIKVGDPVAVYGTSGAGRPDSTHLIHREKTNEDGAIVLSPTTSPTFLLFKFADDTF